MRKIAVIGATSVIAQWCARHWVDEAPADVVLCGRDLARIEEVAADLRVRSPQSRVEARVVDFERPERIEAEVGAICSDGPPDTVLIAHGWLPAQADCEQDVGIVRQALLVNAVSPAMFAEAFARHLGAAGRGTLILLGSVAGDRGRRKIYVYGAAKGLLERYAQGLQHRFARTGVNVVLAKPGPTDTPMTAHIARGGLASPRDVARRIVDGAARGRPVVYAPGRWAFIMFVIRHLPRALFDRLDI